MSDRPPEPAPSASPPNGAVLQELQDLSHKVDLVAGALATIAAGHHELLDHVAESVARQSHDAVAIADRLAAIERQVLTATGGATEAESRATETAVVERLQAIERAVAALPGAAPGVESTFVALADRLDALADGERERREAIAGLTAAVESLHALADEERPPTVVGPDLRPELQALTDAQFAVADELAALGQRVNELLDRHPDGLPLPPRAAVDLVEPDAVTPPPADVDLAPLEGQVADLAAVTAAQANDLTLALEVLSKVAESIDRLDARTDDRLAAIREASTTPVADLRAVAELQALVVAGGERRDAQMEELGGLIASLVEAQVAPTAPAEAERSSDAALLEARLTHHMDIALAGVLRLFDDRLVALRASLGSPSSVTAAPAPPPSPAGGSMGGFEAGAVMGAAQAAWTRLEQRIDQEFDDLSRQLQAVAALVEQAVASTESLANRPVVTGDQVKRAAVTLRDTVVNANRQRRDRRGGPKGLGPGSSGY